MLDENKKKEDLLKAKKMEASLKIGADMIGQLKKITEQREVEEKKAKEEGIRERQRLELEVKLLEEAEKKKELERRSRLKELTESDRKAKRLQSLDFKEPEESPVNLMSRVFERPTHAAFERRAKNDQVVSFITEKFFTGQHDRGASKLNPEEIVRLKNEQEAAEQEARK